MRDNERAAAALGVSVAGAKLYAFGLGAAIAARRGLLPRLPAETINYTQFAPFASIAIVVFVVIGGVGFVIGARRWRRRSSSAASEARSSIRSA